MLELLDMKTHNRGFIVPLLLAIIALLIVGGGVYVFSQRQQTNSPAIVSPTTQSTSTTQVSDLKTYANSTYGFSFNYPGTSYFGTSDYGSIKTFTNSPIAFVQLTDNSQTEGYLTVSISSNSAEVAKCTSPGAFVLINNNSDIPAQYREVLAGNAKNITINGVTFLQYDVTSHDSIMGAERQYTAMHNGSCVDIRLSTFPSACVNSGCDDRRWSVQTETVLLNQLDIIAKTFKFQ